MCLVVKKPTAKVASKDIVCYKVVKYIPSYGWVTPYYYVDITKECTTFGEMVCNERIKKRYTPQNEYEIGSGVIHCFTTYNEAVAFASLWQSRYYKVMKCLIPRGTRYYMGTCTLHKNEYNAIGAKKIKFQELCV